LRWQALLTSAKKEHVIKADLSHDEFVSLLAKHSPKLMSFIRILTMNRQHETEEIFQLTCLVLWQKFSQYDPSGDFSAWACRIAHYEMLKYRESNRRVSILSDDALRWLSDAALPISNELSERRTALSHCLKKLPDSGRNIIRQKYFEGLSVEEISKRAGRSPYAIYREVNKLHGVLLRCVQRSVTEGLS
jgi:RNA polymerase sigma-70 factor (ECF subfamily)